jgi:hypothetical protein
MLVKNHFERIFTDEELVRRMVYVNGHEVHSNSYFEKHRPAVDAGLEELRHLLRDRSEGSANPVRQTSLLQYRRGSSSD